MHHLSELEARTNTRPTYKQCHGVVEMNGKRYQVYTAVDGSPYVRSEQSGMTLTIPWADLINVAVAQGIDREVNRPDESTGISTWFKIVIGKA